MPLVRIDKATAERLERQKAATGIPKIRIISFATMNFSMETLNVKKTKKE